MPGVLARLALLTGRTEHLARADAIIRTFAGELSRNIFPLGTYLASFETRLWPLQIVLIGTAGEAAELQRVVQGLALPTRILQRIEDGAALPSQHPAFGKHKIEDKPTAYVCRGETCSLPITEAVALRDELLRARVF
jgi:hypothetical protein